MSEFDKLREEERAISAERFFKYQTFLLESIRFNVGPSPSPEEIGGLIGPLIRVAGNVSSEVRLSNGLKELLQMCEVQLKVSYFKLDFRDSVEYTDKYSKMATALVEIMNR